MKKQRKSLWIALCGVVASLGLMLGVWSNGLVRADAAATPPTLTMDAGASVRKTAGDPGLKFKATIEGWNGAYNYGMLILPAQAWDTYGWWGKNVDYVNFLLGENLTAGKDFIQVDCPVYKDSKGNSKIALAITDLNDYNYATEFVGVAYAEKGGVYTYAPVNVADNARSMAYVSQKALRYEQNLSKEQTLTLQVYANPGVEIDTENYFTGADMDCVGETMVVPAEYAMKYTFNVSGETVSQVTKQAYAGGSKVSFKYFIPAGTVTSWWGMGWSTTNTGLNIYDTASASTGYQPSKVTGAWTTVQFTLPAGGPYYLYFGSEVGAAHGRWMVNGENSYALIDDFKVGDEVETFGANLHDSAFSVLAAGVESYQIKPGSISFEKATATDEPEETNKELALKIMLNNGNDGVRARTTNAYAGGSTIEFKYYIQADKGVNWTRLIWDTDTSCDNYGEPYTSFGNTAGKWTTWSYTLPAGGPFYLYFGFECGHWSDSSGAPFVLIDDFTVNGVVEDFNAGVENSCFTILQSSLAFNSADGEGWSPLQGEFGAKIYGDKISSTATTPTFITRNAYTFTETTVVTFDYFMSGNTLGKWWTLGWTSNQKSADIYAGVDKNHTTATNDAYALPTKTQGAWTSVSVSVPAGTWYFYFAMAKGEWSGGHVIIDNFKIGDICTETFNKGIDTSIFLVSPFSSHHAAVELADGVQTGAAVEPESGDKNSLDYLLQKGTVVDYLEKDGYAAIKTSSGVTIDKTDLPLSTLLLEGSLSYSVDGNKEFALYFGGGGFLFISEGKIALYNGVNLVKEVACNSASIVTLQFSVTAGGKVIVMLESDYVGLGTLNGDVTMVKLVALGGDGKVSFGDFSVDAYYCKLANAPIYFSLEQIDFTAYAFDSNAMISDAGFKLLAEAGFTKSLALLQGRRTDGDLHEQDLGNRTNVEKLMEEVNKDALAALALAEKYGLKHYVLNSNLYNLERNPNNYQWVDDFAELATYTLSEAFAGHFLADEPERKYSILSGKLTTDELAELVNAYKAYKQAFPNGEAFINLLPNTSSALSNESRYIEYVKYYIENIALDKDGVKGTGYVSFDHYPLVSSGITAKHLRNLELVAEMCRDYGIELRTYIKASTDGDSKRSLRATESVNDLYLQIYSALAYGSKEIIYYQFTDHTTTDGSAGDGVISGVTLEKGNVYNWAKQANNEVHAFGSAYMNFAWKSVSVFGKTSITQFNNLNNKASAYGALTGVSSSASVLVGNFDDSDGEYTYGAKNAYMVVNYGNTDNMTHATSEITLNFTGVNKVLVYENGVGKVFDLSNGSITLNLELGEGAFVIPFNA